MIGAVALAVALVVVAFVCRDVVLRVVASQNRAADVEAVRALVQEREEALIGRITPLARDLRVLREDHGVLVGKVEGVEKTVEVLRAKTSLGGRA